jgi:hypothetical protein
MIKIEIKDLVNKNLELLPSEKTITQQEANIRSGRFLYVIAELANYQHELLNKKISADSQETIYYNTAITSTEGRDAEARKAGAKANPSYIAAKEVLAQVDADLVWVKATMSVFENASILYRQIGKE